MEWGDPGEALRAKADLARRHAEEMRDTARRQSERAAEVRETERKAVEVARAKAGSLESFLHCQRCNAVWDADAIAEAMRREPCCLLCGGPLAPVP